MVCLPGMERFWWECGRMKGIFPWTFQQCTTAPRLQKTQKQRRQITGSCFAETPRCDFNSFAFERFPGFPLFGATCVVKIFITLIKQTTHQNSVSLLMLMGVQVPITKSKGKRDFSGATELLGSCAHLAIHAATMLGVHSTQSPRWIWNGKSIAFVCELLPCTRSRKRGSWGKSAESAKGCRGEHDASMQLVCPSSFFRKK